MITTTMDTRKDAASGRIPVQASRFEDRKGREGLASPARISAGLALLRVLLGIVFIAHGGQKLFSFTLPGVVEAFTGMGIQMPGVAGPAVALTEFIGGIALVVGLFTPVIALALAAVMLGALFMVHLAAGFFLPNGIEFALVLGGAAVALALTGPGAYSLDAFLARRRSTR